MSTLKVDTIRNEADGTDVAINRTTSDGTIIDLQKDGTTVGSIGSRAGVVTTVVLNPASSNGAGLSGGTKCIVPADESSIIDNDISLGISTHRFKNLYLSGGVYLGGTGSANYLDDYEEGTWTPSINGGTLTISNTALASYTKIGSFVHIQAYLRFDTENGDSSQLNIGGLPFTALSDGYAVFSVNKGGSGGPELANPHLRVNANNTTLLGFYNFNQTAMQQSQMHGDHFIFSGTYKTNS